jgi:hypothetical protein
MLFDRDCTVICPVLGRQGSHKLLFYRRYQIPVVARYRYKDNEMKVVKLNIYTAVAGLFLAVVAGQGKQVISGGGTIVIQNSVQDEKAVIAGGATVVTKDSVVATPSTYPSVAPSVSPSVMPSTYPSTGPSAVPTPVIGQKIIPASPKETENSAAARTSGKAGMLLISLLSWVISL